MSGQAAASELVGVESRIPPALAAVVAAVLYVRLPEKFVSGSTGTAATTFLHWAVPALEVLILTPLVITTPRYHLVARLWRRRAVLGLIGLVSAANGASIVLLVHLIITGRKLGGHELVIGSIDIWWTNIIVFSLWFWLLDGGGPLRRRVEQSLPERDFLFPQMADPSLAPGGWLPVYLDYLYVSFTNAAAFSPTDTMPLTQWAKLLMMVESAASLLTLLMVASRAVNILQ